MNTETTSVARVNARVVRGTAAGAEATSTRFPLLAPLQVRNYALLWAGDAVSLAGDQFQTVALAALVLDGAGGAAVLGAVLGVQAMPRAVLMLVGGVVADRFQPRLVALVANAVQGVLVAALTAALLSAQFSLWYLYAYALASGAALAFSVPAARALMPSLVPLEQLRGANALASLNVSLSGSIFAPLAGFVVARVGIIPAFALNALSFFVAAGAVRAIRVEGVPTARPAGSPLAELREGIAVAHADRAVWVTILTVAVFQFGSGGATLVGLPTLATLAYGAGTQGVGVLFGALGGGAVLGSVLVGSVRSVPRLGLFVGVTTLGWGIAFALVGAAPSLGVAAGLLVVVGVLRGMGGTACVSFVQARAPAEARGRVMALLFFGVLGLGPVSLAAGGVLGEAFGPRVLILCGGALMVLAGIYALAQEDLRRAT
jgi:MFS family permease